MAKSSCRDIHYIYLQHAWGMLHLKIEWQHPYYAYYALCELCECDGS
jgi:hypothetical protein